MEYGRQDQGSYKNRVQRQETRPHIEWRLQVHYANSHIPNHGNDAPFIRSGLWDQGANCGTPPPRCAAAGGEKLGHVLENLGQTIRHVDHDIVAAWHFVGAPALRLGAGVGLLERHVRIAGRADIGLFRDPLARAGQL